MGYDFRSDLGIVDWNSRLGSICDVIVHPCSRTMQMRSGLTDRFTPLVGGVISTGSFGPSFSSVTSADGWVSGRNFNVVSGATSLSVFVAMNLLGTNSNVFGRWGAAANVGGFLLTCNSGALVTVIAESSSTSLWSAKRSGGISSGPIRYGMTWEGGSVQNNYLSGALSNGSAWFAGSPSSIQTVGEKLYIDRHADSASGMGYTNIAFIAFGVNRVWSASEHAMFARGFESVFARRKVFVPSMAVIPSLSAATYMPGSITSSGFRPRVTAS